MTDAFADLHGRSLISFAREVTGSLRWDTIDVGADGGVEPYDQWRDALHFYGTGVPPPPPPPPPTLVAAIAAIRIDRVRLLADGDHTLEFAEVVVPSGLLRGRWRVRVTWDGEEWVRSISPNRTVVGPTYLRPRFAAAKKPAVAKRTGTAGRPTSWYLVEAECRRRYNEGERHAVRSAWASVLLAWLRENHQGSAPLSLKTGSKQPGWSAAEARTGVA